MLTGSYLRRKKPDNDPQQKTGPGFDTKSSLEIFVIVIIYKKSKIFEIFLRYCSTTIDILGVHSNSGSDPSKKKKKSGSKPFSKAGYGSETLSERELHVRGIRFI